MIPTSADLTQFSATSSRIQPGPTEWVYDAGYNGIFVPIQPGFFNNVLGQFNVQTGDSLFVKFTCNPFATSASNRLYLGYPNLSLRGVFAILNNTVVINWLSTIQYSTTITDISTASEAVFPLIAPGVVVQFSIVIGAPAQVSGTSIITFKVSGSAFTDGAFSVVSPVSAYNYSVITPVTSAPNTNTYISIPIGCSVATDGGSTGTSALTCTMSVVTPDQLVTYIEP